MKTTPNILKIINVNRKTGTAIAWGTGTVIHADRKKAIVLTAAHVIGGNIQIHWSDAESFNKYWRFSLRASAITEELEGECLCVPEYLCPDIGLLLVTNLKGHQFDAVPVFQGASFRGTVSVFGYASEEFELSKVNGEIVDVWEEKFPEYSMLGSVPFGFSGGPLITDGKIVGLVEKGVRNNETRGLFFTGIRRMLANWSAGKYVSSPYHLWPHDQLPPIIQLPEGIKEALRGL